MTKKLMFLILIVFALIVGGCSEQIPFEAQSDDASLINHTPASLAKKGNKQVHIKGSFQTMFQFIPLVCIDPAIGTPVDCSTPGAVPMLVSSPYQGTGTISPFGDFIVFATQTVDFTAAPPKLYGTNEFAAPNGDKLYATHKGVGVPDNAGNFALSVEIKFKGGTGMFKHARGKMTATGGASMANMTGHFSFEGLIKLEKAERGKGDHDDDDDD